MSFWLFVVVLIVALFGAPIMGAILMWWSDVVFTFLGKRFDVFK